MRAFAIALVVLVGCAEHGSGGPQPPDSPLVVDPQACGPEGTPTTQPDGTQCFIEGHAACNVPPPSGGCTATAGKWHCFSSCPAGCPDEQPAQGAPCVTANACPYEAPPFSPTRVVCNCTPSGVDCR